MKAVVSEFTIQVQGRTRDETIQRMENVCLAFLTEVGGNPWLMVDDDIKRLHVPQYALSDDQGFAYTAIRRYSYQGPAMAGPGVRIHENFNVQNGVE